jgi:hypothetical protein
MCCMPSKKTQGIIIIVIRHQNFSKNKISNWAKPWWDTDRFLNSLNIDHIQPKRFPQMRMISSYLCRFGSRNDAQPVYTPFMLPYANAMNQNCFLASSWVIISPLTHKYTLTKTHLQTQTHTHGHTRTHINKHRHTQTHTDTHMDTQTHAQTHGYIHTWTHKHMETYTHIFKRIT